jgi:hypothetical protein
LETFNKASSFLVIGEVNFLLEPLVTLKTGSSTVAVTLLAIILAVVEKLKTIG